MKPGAGGEGEENAAVAEAVAGEGVEGSKNEIPPERGLCLPRGACSLSLAVDQM